MNQQDPIAAEAVNELTSAVSEMSVSEMSVSEMSVSEMSVEEVEVVELEPMGGAAEAEPITAETDAAPAP